MNIVVVGGGRMGLPLACAFAKNGASVTVCDIDSALVEEINRGDCPYEEPGLAELLQMLHRRGALRASCDTTASVASAQAIVVIVPAHLTADREIDLSILHAASAAVGKGLQRGAIVIYETTIAVGGTRRHLIPVLENESGMKAGSDFLVAYSPERVKANLVFARLEQTPKVVGGLDAASCALVTHMYATYLRAPVRDVGSLEAAEMTKLLGMLYRDVNIALANELAAFCELAGVDFERVRGAANEDGEANLLVPGIGVGGHCTPVYPYFLTRESRRLGMMQRLSEAAREINDLQPSRQLDRIARFWGSLGGRRVHILGLGFRPGVKVDTFSPAYALRDDLQQHGAIVTLEDPYYSEVELKALGFQPGIARDAALVVLNTAHPEFGEPDFDAWRRGGVEVVLDGRNLWDQRKVEALDLLYFGIGRSCRLEFVRR
ncbi:nucleotide sugar dehydrogenase [Rhizobacter sp. Root404]|uniref:nucleotide sugar dehydrogenase n=1 Tax=Rhizobacter sp. Root404 TaxID=1736528 RepID=UPI0006FB4851|nr:nucleotide sugar dehydrogenase [Rhizobacter sp. Root404]KQW37682.1 nucleotide sugar dehydrogenase [Rhizobacter sp. Root404]